MPKLYFLWLLLTASLVATAQLQSREISVPPATSATGINEGRLMLVNVSELIQVKEGDSVIIYPNLTFTKTRKRAGYLVRGH